SEAVRCSADAASSRCARWPGAGGIGARKPERRRHVPWRAEGSLRGGGAQAGSACAAEPGDLACQVVEPVQISTLRFGSATLTLEPAVTLSCEMATRAAAWLGDSVRPLARGTFERDLVSVRVGGGHECRRR